MTRDKTRTQGVAHVTQLHSKMAHRAVYVVTPTVHVAVLNQGARVVIAHRDGRRAQEAGVGGRNLRASRHPIVLAIIAVRTVNTSD